MFLNQIVLICRVHKLPLVDYEWQLVNMVDYVYFEKNAKKFNLWKSRILQRNSSFFHIFSPVYNVGKS